MHFSNSRQFVIGTLVVLTIISSGKCFAPRRGCDCGGVKIVTYGQPCLSRNLPIRIEGPKAPVEEPKPVFQMKYEIIRPEVQYVSRTEYPIAIDIPEVPQTPSEQIVAVPDVLRGRTYGYDILGPPEPIQYRRKSYNFGVDVPPPKPEPYQPAEDAPPVKLLTGLTSKVDRVLVPACDLHGSGSCPCNLFS